MKIISPMRHKKARIEIIPLIDIMFFLLASFMLVSLSLVRLEGMRFSVPGLAHAEATPSETPDYTMVFVDDTGAILYGKEKVPVNEDDMLNRLKALRSKEKDPRVYINASRDVANGRVLEVLALIRNIGIEKVTFSIRKTAGGGGAAPAPGAIPGAGPGAVPGAAVPSIPAPVPGGIPGGVTAPSGGPGAVPPAGPGSAVPAPPATQPPASSAPSSP